MTARELNNPIDKGGAGCIAGRGSSDSFFADLGEALSIGLMVYQTQNRRKKKAGEFQDLLVGIGNKSCMVC